MIDINQYNYSAKLFTKMKKLHILPLTPDGLNTYYSKNSHCHKFLTNRLK